MLIACWSPKGGSGTTVVSVALAVMAARHRAARGALLADLAGDVPAVLGLPDPRGPGLGDWMAAGDDVPEGALVHLQVEAGPGLHVLPMGSPPVGAADRADALAGELAAGPRVVVADCGAAASGAQLAVAAAATLSVVVLHPCYLALRRALAAPISPSGVVLVEEPERALSRLDVEDVLGVPVLAHVPYEAAVARAVDTGLLGRRLPRRLERALWPVATLFLGPADIGRHPLATNRHRRHRAHPTGRTVP